jgi:hypothetical protein
MNRLIYPLLLLVLLFGAVASASRAADTQVIGRLVEINLLTNTLGLDTGSRTASVSVQPYTWIYKDRWESLLPSLRLGDRVRAVVFPSGSRLNALRIEAQSQAESRTEQWSGRIARLSILPGLLGTLWIEDALNPKGNPIPLSLDPGTLLIRNGGYVTPILLLPGDFVSAAATLLPDGSRIALRVEASSTERRSLSVSGIVKETSGRTVTVQTWKSGVKETLVTDAGTALRKNRATIAVRDLKRGDQVFAMGARIASGEVSTLSITVQSPDAEWTGTVMAVNSSESWIVVSRSNADPVTLLLLPATILRVNGQDAGIREIQVGSRITVRCIVHEEGPWGATSAEITRAEAG